MHKIFESTADRRGVEALYLLGSFEGVAVVAGCFGAHRPPGDPESPLHGPENRDEMVRVARRSWISFTDQQKSAMLQGDAYLELSNGTVLWYTPLSNIAAVEAEFAYNPVH